MVKKNPYRNVRVSFDIETTSYIDNDVKRAIVYSYAFCVDGNVTVLRRADEFLDFIQGLITQYEASTDHPVVVWVHNLAYEWQFIRQHFTWESVFANGEATNVIKAVTDEGIEFRCTYALTNASLAQVGKKVGVAKGGDFDYELLRHSETPLTDEEMGYIYNDVLIMDALLKERLAEDTLDTIPMTKTGYVRRMVRGETMNKPYEGGTYRDWIRDLTLDTDTYQAAHSAYQGGYTHANAKLAGMAVPGVKGCDIASSYPASLAQFQFPVSNFTEVPQEDLDDPDEVLANLEQLACLVDVTFVGLESVTQFPPISESKCLTLAGAVSDNGRVYSAESARVVITDVDFRLYMRAYDNPEFVINKMWVSQYEYLPSTLIGTILSLYNKKTTLKGVKGAEKEYAAAKEDLNSIYGMMATDPVRTVFEEHSDGTLEVMDVSLEDSLETHNTARKRFTFYPWGTWVTAYSRTVLLTLIYDMEDAGIEVMYCDTDSDYFVDHPEAQRIIDENNAAIEHRMTVAMNHHIAASESAYFDAYDADDPDSVRRSWAPLDPAGEGHPLGYFEMDAEPIDEFKTLGAKRYLKNIGGELSATVAGLSKGAVKYIDEHGGMDFFADGMVIPEDHSGRMIHSYSDDVAHNLMTDYLGNTAEVFQRGYVHLMKSEYHLGVSEGYTEFMQRMQTPQAFR